MNKILYEGTSSDPSDMLLDCCTFLWMNVNIGSAVLPSFVCAVSDFSFIKSIARQSRKCRQSMLVLLSQVLVVAKASSRYLSLLWRVKNKPRRTAQENYVVRSRVWWKNWLECHVSSINACVVLGGGGLLLLMIWGNV